MKFALASMFVLSSCAPAQMKMPDNIVIEKNVPYGSHPRQVLDIYRPANLGGRLRPAVFFIHGGGWTGMTKDEVVATHIRRYVERSFIAVNVEYRVAKDALAPAAVQDVRAAGRWMLANAARLGVDTNRIVVSGNSAGGHLAMMSVLPMDEAKYGTGLRPAAIVNIYGIMDVADLLAGPNQRNYAVTWMKGLEKTGLPAELSPLQHLQSGLPPVLTVHGDADESVPYAHALRITEGLKKFGVRAELITVPGGKHGFPPEKWAELYPRIFQFVDGALK